MGPFGSMDQTGRQGSKMAKVNKFFNLISNLSSILLTGRHCHHLKWHQILLTSIQYMIQFHQVGFNIQVCCATVRPKRWLPTDRWHSEFTPASRHIRINDTFVFRNGFQVRLRRSYEAQRRIIQQQ